MYAVIKITPVENLDFEPPDWILRNGAIYKKEQILMTGDVDQAQGHCDSCNLLAKNGIEYYVADIN